APSGHDIIGHGLEACIERGVQEVGWPKVRRHAKDSGIQRRGWGMGCEMHGSGADPAMQEQGNALVKMNEDGTVRLYTAPPIWVPGHIPRWRKSWPKPSA